MAALDGNSSTLLDLSNRRHCLQSKESLFHLPISLVSPICAIASEFFFAVESGYVFKYDDLIIAPFSMRGLLFVG